MPEAFKRKLAAILSADVAGYSRMMSDDEASTVCTLKDHRKTISDLVKKHKGRVVDTTGDNLMAEYGSVVDSVECSIEIQEILHSKNDELPENRRMMFRIGINLGDVIAEDGRIYGDGVNIAARVETLAEPGGICLSGEAYDHVSKKLHLDYEFLGEKTAKNIKKPIRVYKIPIKPKEFLTDSLIDLSVPTDKPSIAVLPFVNMSSDPEQEYFSDGMTEEIITALSKVPDLLVIARNSTFTYKGKAVDVKQVGKELGVRYVLEGSVRKAGNRIRLTAQLIDSKTGSHLWADRYDRELKDIFAIQDEITLKIIMELEGNITGRVRDAIVGKGTTNLEAYLKFLQARYHMGRVNQTDFVLARQLAEEITNLDHNWSTGYVLRAWTYLIYRLFGLGTSLEGSLQEALRFVEKAISLDPTTEGAYGIKCRVLLEQGEYEKAITEGEKIIALSPFPDNLFWYGYALNYAGRPKEAIKIFKKAININPKDVMLLIFLGVSYSDSGQYKDAVEIIKKALSMAPNNILALSRLAASYSLVGLMEDARKVTEKINEIDPSYSLEVYEKIAPYKNQSDTDRILNALRKAGLK
jgi:adenylate cyclase